MVLGTRSCICSSCRWWWWDSPFQAAAHRMHSAPQIASQPHRPTRHLHAGMQAASYRIRMRMLPRPTTRARVRACSLLALPDDNAFVRFLRVAITRDPALAVLFQDLVV